MNFYTYLVIPSDSKIQFEEVPRYINKVMQYFDQDLEVSKYYENCYCISRLAYDSADKYVSDLHKGSVLDRSAMIYYQQHFDDHPLKDKPNPKCPECRGRGKIESIINPNGKWLFYDIGGNWDGTIQGTVITKELCEEFSIPSETPLFQNDLENNISLVSSILEGPDLIFKNNQLPQALVCKKNWYQYDNNSLDWFTQVNQLLTDNIEGLVIGLDCQV